MREHQKTRPSRAWAPILAGLIVGAFFLPRLDSVFYFLHGLESQGINLAVALADGHGFVDLTLPGHPAHVREPPLFYLALAALIRLFGLKMLPLKIFTWAGYTMSAVLAVILFQKRSSSLVALSAAVLALTTPDMFRFLSGPKSDLPFTAVMLAAIIAFESTHDALARLYANKNSRPGRAALPAALATGSLIAMAVMMRSLGLALLLGAGAALALGRRDRIALKPRLVWAAIIALPVVLVFGGWTVRNLSIPNPAGYSYFDWFLMDLPPDSPAMTAIDFHAPLAAPPPPVSPAGFAHRVARHLWLYGAALGGSLHAFEWWKAAGARSVVLALMFLFAVAALVRIEIVRRRWMVPVTAASYLMVLLIWPMDDARLLMPLAPLAAFYFLAGLDLALRRAVGPRSRRAALLLAAGAILVFNIWYAAGYQRSAERLPTEDFRPGFQVRFTSRQALDSYRLLVWSGRNLEPGAVLMYHSAPPGRLISGHECNPIPYTGDMGRARDYIVDGGADYLIVDEWGRAFPGGSGWFVERVLRPVIAQYPDDFEPLWQVPGRDARVYRVRKK